MRNITPKVDGSGDVLLADAFNANLITELQNFVTNAGITLDPESGPDTDTSMFAKSVVIHALASQYFDDTGSANVYELSHSGGLESIPGYVDGSVVIFKAGTTNTGASSIEIDSLGAKNLVSDHGEALSGGEVIANQYIFARYRSDNDEFELLSSVGNFLRKDITDTLDYGVTIANETSYSAFNSLGTAYNVATLSGDILTIGYSLFPVSILSDGNLTHNGSIVWTEANAGTGSGLVADMVDGYHADSSPIPESGLLKVGDWGAARYTLDFTGLSVDDAFFTININGSNITGAPDTNSWFVSALGDGTNTAQMAFSQVDDKKIRVRGYNGVSWSNWSTPLSFEGHTHVETDIVDLDKYTQNEIDTAMALKADASLIGAASGICPLDAGSLVDSSYLPSYVDDVIEAADYASLPGTGETGKIYITLDTGNIYRWTGSAYIEINTSVATADEAVALATARTIAIGGDATGSNTFDGTSNVTITVNVTDSEALGGVAAASWLRSDTADDVSGALTFSAAPVLQNAIMLSAITTGATTYGIAGINASDQAAIGNAALPLALLSSGIFTHNGDTIWTSGNDGVGSGLDAGLFGGQLPSYYTNASNIDAGTISDDRLPSSISSDITGNAATASNASQLNGKAASYYAVDTATVKVNTDNAIAGYVVADGVGHYNATNGITLLGPKGASYVNTTGTVNGAIKITLPGSWTTSLIHMRIKIFEFGSNLPFEITCGGYNRNDITTWQSTFAYTLSSRENIRDTAIRFAHDGAKCAIFIGELAGSWSYPQVFVTDLSIGYTNFSPSIWHDGWAIGFEVSSFGTVSATISNSDLGKYLSEYYISQSAVNAQTTDNTLTAANIATKIITVNNGAAGTTTLTLPLAGDMDTGFPHAPNDFGFEFSVINISTVASEDCTIATNTGWTLVGSMVIESFDADRARSTGRFFARKTGTGAWTLYRIA